MQNLRIHIMKWVCICAAICMTTSCTYDYFQDETNFWLYVPQMKNNEIKNFYVAFHDAGGKNIIVREVTAPFNKDSFMEQGILRFRLSPGEYSITCFADYADGSITRGAPLVGSYKAKELDNSEPDLYISRVEDYTTDPRFLAFNRMVYPVGHPASKDTVISDMTDIQRYKGEIITKFIDLPAVVARIDILYTGLATKLKFDGTLDRFSPQDRIIASIDVGKYRASGKDGNGLNNIVFTDKINPSAGLNFNDYVADGFIGSAEPVRLEIRFFDRNGGVIGVARVGEEDILGLSPDKRPVDKEGNPVTSLVLEPRRGIVFTFKGFTIFRIELIGWGGIEEGEISPM